MILVNEKELGKFKFLSFLDLKCNAFKLLASPLCLENLDDILVSMRQCKLSDSEVWEPGGNGRHEVMESDVEIVP